MASHEPPPRTTKRPLFEGRVGQERLVAIIVLAVAATVIMIMIMMGVFSGNDNADTDYWGETPSSSSAAWP